MSWFFLIYEATYFQGKLQPLLNFTYMCVCMYVCECICVCLKLTLCAIRGAFIHDDQAELFQFQ